MDSRHYSIIVLSFEDHSKFEKNKNFLLTHYFGIPFNSETTFLLIMTRFLN